MPRDNRRSIRRFAVGLEVHINEIGALLRLQASTDCAALEKSLECDIADELGNTGNTRSNAWYDWVAEVVLYSELNGIDTTMKAPEFHKTVQGLLKARKQVSPGPASTAKAFRAIRFRLREHQNSEKLMLAGKMPIDPG